MKEKNNNLQSESITNSCVAKDQKGGHHYAGLIVITRIQNT